MSGDHSHHHRRSHQFRSRYQYQGRRLPDRWEIYDNVGRDIEGTRFVPFKTPLDPSFFHGKEMPLELQFSVKSLIDMANRANKKIGLVIDLTNTDRYYNKSEWSRYDIDYVKLNCPGHEVNEREDLVEEFIKIVREFVENPENNGKLVGVHCTHGLNRTGYLICRYLIDVENYSAMDAIGAFEFYRGHPMERPNYKKSLCDAEVKKYESKQVIPGGKDGIKIQVEKEQEKEEAVAAGDQY